MARESNKELSKMQSKAEGYFISKIPRYVSLKLAFVYTGSI